MMWRDSTVHNNAFGIVRVPFAALVLASVVGF
jgi:hypothetical protein